MCEHSVLFPILCLLSTLPPSYRFSRCFSFSSLTSPCPSLNFSFPYPPLNFSFLFLPSPLPSGPVMHKLLLEAKPRMTQFTGSSTVAEILAKDLHGRLKLEDAGWDWKVMIFSFLSLFFYFSSIFIFFLPLSLSLSLSLFLSLSLSLSFSLSLSLTHTHTLSLCVSVCLSVCLYLSLSFFLSIFLLIYYASLILSPSSLFNFLFSFFLYPSFLLI